MALRVADLARIVLVFQIYNLCLSMPAPLGEKRRQVPVLILSEMRSGSSLIGDLFNADPENFYMYEPLRALENLGAQKKEACYLNGTCLSTTTDTKDMEVLEIRKMLTCNHNNVNTATMWDDFLLRSASTLPFAQCIRTGGFQASKIPKCLPVISGKCQESKLNVIKTIRLRLNDITSLLQENQNLKIIHLVRDPRAIVNSRKKLGIPSGKNFVTKLCSKMTEDIEWKLKHQSNFRDRVMTIRYESFANDPILSTNKIFSFLNLVTPEIVNSWVKDNTLNEKDIKSGDYSTTNRNAKLTANRWRQEIDIEMAASIDRQCKAVLRTYNYTLIRDKHSLKS